MIKVNIILDYNKWKKKLENPDKYFKKRLKVISKMSRFKKKREFSILLTNNEMMKKFNLKFRKKNKSTDVLSFPLNSHFEKKHYIGDIALSFEIINKRSKSSNFSIELDRMWIHGFLHLIGYDHKRLKDFEIMNKEEKFLLKNLYKKIDYKTL